MSELWVEKHRPQSVNQIRGQAAVVQRLIIYSEKKEFPHLLFAGPPGTGKTTMARILGDIYKEIGILEKGHVVEVDRSDLVAGYVGQTAPKTKEKLKTVAGRVLNK